MVVKLADRARGGPVHRDVGDLLDDVEAQRGRGSVQRELGAGRIARGEGQPGGGPVGAAVHPVLGTQVDHRDRAAVEGLAGARLVVQRVGRLHHGAGQSAHLAAAPDGQGGPGGLERRHQRGHRVERQHVGGVHEQQVVAAGLRGSVVAGGGLVGRRAAQPEAYVVGRVAPNRLAGGAGITDGDHDHLEVAVGLVTDRVQSLVDVGGGRRVDGHHYAHQRSTVPGPARSHGGPYPLAEGVRESPVDASERGSESSLRTQGSSSSAGGKFASC